MEDQLKEIYNQWLISGRKAKNKPYKRRENFDDVSEKLVDTLTRLQRFFDKFPNIRLDDFFTAPYKMVVGEDEHFPLDYYLNKQAISMYTTYMKSLEMESPDSEDSMERLKKSFKNIYAFCKKEGLTFQKYVTYSNLSEALPIITTHLKSHEINFYALHALQLVYGKEITKMLKDEKDVLEFMIPDFDTIFTNTRSKFYASSRMKEFSKKAISAFDEILGKSGD